MYFAMETLLAKLLNTPPEITNRRLYYRRYFSSHPIESYEIGSVTKVVPHSTLLKTLFFSNDIFHHVSLMIGSHQRVLPF